MLTTEKNGERLIYLDYLRVIATFVVIFLHVSASNWMVADVYSSAWGVFNTYNAATRWGVPAFVMISGALFLPRQLDTGTLYKKYILKLVTVYFLWAIFYAFANPVIYKLFDKPIGFSLQGVITVSLTGSYHMWYLPTIIGLYMCLPLLQPIAQDLKRCRYFLALAAVFAVGVPQVIGLIADFGGEKLLPYADAIWVLNSNLNIQTVLGYAGYFMAGYYLSVTEFSPKRRKIIYLLGIAGFVFSAVLNLALSRRLGTPSQNYLGNFTLGPMLEAVAVFVWCKYHLRGEKLHSVVKSLSKYSLGVYLVHPLVLTGLDLMGMHSLRFAPILSIPLLAVLIAAISFGISWVLHQIPVIRKIAV